MKKYIYESLTLRRRLSKVVYRMGHSIEGKCRQYSKIKAEIVLLGL